MPWVDIEQTRTTKSSGYGTGHVDYVRDKVSLSGGRAQREEEPGGRALITIVQTSSRNFAVSLVDS